MHQEPDAASRSALARRFGAARLGAKVRGVGQRKQVIVETAGLRFGQARRHSQAKEEQANESA
jgi:hypothetical protein